MRWLQEEAARMKQEEEEEAAKEAARQQETATMRSSVSLASSTSARPMSYVPASSLDPTSSLGLLAAKARKHQSVSVYLSTGPTATQDRSIFVSKYIPLLRTLCVSSGVSINFAQHGGSGEALASVVGSSALDASLSAVDTCDVFVGIFGGEAGPAVSQEQLELV
jgi:hypothetical protein